MELASLFLVTVAAILSVLLAAALDIWRRGCSADLTWPQALSLYSRKVIRSWKMYQLHQQFVINCKNFEQCQTKLLLSTLQDHKSSVYGQDKNFSSVRDVKQFRLSQPVTEYGYYKEYVDRMAAGEISAMFGNEQNIEMFLDTSGTTGVNKKFPLSCKAAQHMRDSRLLTNEWAVWNDIASWNLRKSIYISFYRPLKYTKSKHLQGTIANIIFISSDPSDNFATPQDGYLISDELSIHYLHALFGLCDTNIHCIHTLFLATILSFIRRMELHKDDLVADIKRGRIKDDLNIPTDIRTRLEAHLKPRPQRAEEVRRAFASGGKDGLLARLWPELNYVTGICTGVTNEIYYRDTLTYCGSSVPVITGVYGSSEMSIAGIIQASKKLAYTIVPDACFYEFLPVLDDKIQEIEDIKKEDLLLSDKLQLGGEYEIFITNRTGLYRYRVGDVIKVVGFFHKSPQFEFLYRAGQLLSVHSEKVSEKQFYLALEDARRQWPAGIELREYTVATSQLISKTDDSGNLYSLLFLEMSGPPLTEEQRQLVDASLRQHHEMYDQLRKINLGPIAVHRVPIGTFEQYKKQRLSMKRTNPMQFKVAHVLKTKEMVDWFLSQCED